MSIYIKQCNGTEPEYIGCPQYMFYNYFNTEPLGHYYDCPNTAPSCTSPCPPTQTCCSSLSQVGHIYSDDFPPDLVANGIPQAIIYAGSRIDNNGSVGGVTFPAVTCVSAALATLAVDTIVNPAVVGHRMQLPFAAQNSALGGPYGLNLVSIKWYFTC